MKTAICPICKQRKSHFVNLDIAFICLDCANAGKIPELTPQAVLRALHVPDAKIQ